MRNNFVNNKYGVKILKVIFRYLYTIQYYNEQEEEEKKDLVPPTDLQSKKSGGGSSSKRKSIQTEQSDIINSEINEWFTMLFILLIRNENMKKK